MSTTRPERLAVRVVGPHGGWTSPGLLPEEATQLRNRLRREVVSAADAPTLLLFQACGGRSIDIRARDVVAIELVPHVELPPRLTGEIRYPPAADRGLPGRPAAEATPASVPPAGRDGRMFVDGFPVDGTEWLRRLRIVEGTFTE